MQRLWYTSSAHWANIDNYPAHERSCWWCQHIAKKSFKDIAPYYLNITLVGFRRNTTQVMQKCIRIGGLTFHWAWTWCPSWVESCRGLVWAVLTSWSRLTLAAHWHPPINSWSLCSLHHHQPLGSARSRSPSLGPARARSAFSAMHEVGIRKNLTSAWSEPWTSQALWPNLSRIYWPFPSEDGENHFI